ncbi:MAG TPA: four helix bundle protein [Chitinophagaceae bacterium]|nr:four helix bundle protein [Chitinophagaceae bacterium]
MQNYKDLKVWEKAHLFTIKVYESTRGFPKEEVYGLTNQLRRSAFSIPANIAEGCGKNTKNDFANFLNIALGSANESEYFLTLSRDLQYLKEDVYNVLFNCINEVKAMLIALINKVRA